MSDNEIYLLIKYIKSVLCRVVKRLSYIEDARCLKVIDAADKRYVNKGHGWNGTDREKAMCWDKKLSLS